MEFILPYIPFIAMVLVLMGVVPGAFALVWDWHSGHLAHDRRRETQWYLSLGDNAV